MQKFYNAHHSPIGAFCSFTLGYPGAKGGFGIEYGKPADQSVFIGLQIRDADYYQALPFYGESIKQDEHSLDMTVVILIILIME